MNSSLSRDFPMLPNNGPGMIRVHYLSMQIEKLKYKRIVVQLHDEGLSIKEIAKNIGTEESMIEEIIDSHEKAVSHLYDFTIMDVLQSKKAGLIPAEEAIDILSNWPYEDDNRPDEYLIDGWPIFNTLLELESGVYEELLTDDECALIKKNARTKIRKTLTINDKHKNPVPELKRSYFAYKAFRLAYFRSVIKLYSEGVSFTQIGRKAHIGASEVRSAVRAIGNNHENGLLKVSAEEIAFNIKGELPRAKEIALYIEQLQPEQKQEVEEALKSL